MHRYERTPGIGIDGCSPALAGLHHGGAVAGEDVAWQWVVQLPGDLDWPLGPVLDVAGGAGAEVGQCAAAFVLLGGANEQCDRASRAWWWM